MKNMPYIAYQKIIKKAIKATIAKYYKSQIIRLIVSKKQRSPF